MSLRNRMTVHGQLLKGRGGRGRFLGGGGRFLCGLGGRHIVYKSDPIAFAPRIQGPVPGSRGLFRPKAAAAFDAIVRKPNL